MNFFKSNSQSTHISSVGNENTVIVNGLKHTLPKGNVSIINGKIYLNNVIWDGSDVLNENCKPLEIIIQGNCGSISNVKGIVTVNGNVEGHIEAGDSVSCGNVTGDVQSGDSVKCGDVGGNVNAGDSVKCGNVKGKVMAGDSVVCTGRG